MDKSENPDAVFCPLNAVLHLLSERWTLHIIHALLPGTKRFNEIGRELGVNPRTLRERLKALEDEGVIGRTVVSAMPPHVEYALTEKGLALSGVMEEMTRWARAWTEPKGAALMDSTAGDVKTGAERLPRP